MEVNELNMVEKDREKYWKFCNICNLDENVNRQKNHHIIPRRLNTHSTIKIWLCRFCHSMLHKAESMGLCKLPSSDKEYTEWKEDAKNSYNHT